MAKFPSNDSEVEEIVRAETSYEDTPDELPDSQLSTLIEQAQAKLQLRTGSTNWYSDNGLGYALAAYAKMKAKAAVENVPLSSYSLGDTNVSFATTDPDTSQQLNDWAEDVRLGLNASDVDIQDPDVRPANTADYIGESYYNT